MLCRLILGATVPVVQGRAESSNTSAKMVQPQPGTSGEIHTRSRGVDVVNEVVKSGVAVVPLGSP